MWFFRAIPELTCLLGDLESYTLYHYELRRNGFTSDAQTRRYGTRKLDGVTRVEADHEADTVEVVVDNDVADDDIHAAIEQAGYDVTV